MEIDKEIAKLLPEGVGPAPRGRAVAQGRIGSVRRDGPTPATSSSARTSTFAPASRSKANLGDARRRPDGARHRLRQVGRRREAGRRRGQEEQEQAAAGTGELQLANKQELKSDIAEVDASAPRSRSWSTAS